MRKLFSVSVFLVLVLLTAGAGAAQTIYDDPYNQVKVNTPHNEDGQLDGTFQAYVSWGGSRELQLRISVSRTQLTVHQCEHVSATQYAAIGSIENDEHFVTLKCEKWTVRIGKKHYQKARVMEVGKGSTLKDAMVSLGYNEITIAFPTRSVNVVIKDKTNDLRYDDMIYQCTDAGGSYWKVYVRK
jgi:hypothetical protein